MRRFALVLLSVACLCSPSLAQDNFPDVQEDHRALHVLMRLGAEGLVPNVGDIMGDRPAPKARLAAKAIEAVDGLPAVLKKRLAEAKEPSKCKDSPQVWVASIRDAATGWLSGFKKLIELLRPDIKKLGREPNKLLKQLEADQKIADKIVKVYEANMINAGGAPLFRDVPPSHWAWEAVQELRDAGILSGYPDGSFKG